jgi:hypothetical protein
LEVWVRTVATLRKQFDAYRLHHPIAPLAAITDTGLVLGAGTQLVRMEVDQSAQTELALARDEARLFALLEVAFRRPASPNILRHIENASLHWSRGDKALANIHLAFARLPRLESEMDAWCLHLAASMLDDGYSPRRLIRELNNTASSTHFQKYDRNQPRVPAGSGRESGQWTSGDSGGSADRTDASAPHAPPTGSGRGQASGTITAAAMAASTSDVALPLGSLARGLFDRAMTSAFLDGLASLGASVGLGVVLGAAFFPVSTRRTTEGQVPGHPELRFSFDKDEGILRFVQRGVTGDETVAIARGAPNGIFYETKTGTPVARMVGQLLVFDAQSLDDDEEDAKTQAGATSEVTSKAEEPQLCPDPGPDVPHGASARSIAYQAFISALNNPQRPLPPGMAVSLINPKTKRRVTYDDCREDDGTMIEAKGYGFANLLQSSYIKRRLKKRWIGQAMRQVLASGGREIEWYFAEESARDYAEKIFSGVQELRRIRVIYKSME